MQKHTDVVMGKETESNMARIRNEGADVSVDEYPCWIAHPYKLNTNSWICVLGFGEALMTSLTLNFHKQRDISVRNIWFKDFKYL